MLLWGLHLNRNAVLTHVNQYDTFIGMACCVQSSHVVDIPCCICYIAGQRSILYAFVLCVDTELLMIFGVTVIHNRTIL